MSMSTARDNIAQNGPQMTSRGAARDNIARGKVPQ